MKKLQASAQDNAFSHGVFALTGDTQTLTFQNVASAPIPSAAARIFCSREARHRLSDEDLVTLLRHDADSFNRWQSAQQLAVRALKRSVASVRAGTGPVQDHLLPDALAAAVPDEAERDPAFAAYLLALPRDNDIAREIGHDIDPDAIHTARAALRVQVSERMSPILSNFPVARATDELYSPDAASAGRRALRHAALYAASDADSTGVKRVERFFDAADNLTDRHAALIALHDKPGAMREGLFAAFEYLYRNEPLVLDKWFLLQAGIPERETLDRVRKLMTHPVFSLTTPNRVYALIMGFAQGNPREFHRPDGAGHAFIADLILEIDQRNPQVASRLATAFRTWKSSSPAGGRTPRRRSSG